MFFRTFCFLAEHKKFLTTEVNITLAWCSKNGKEIRYVPGKLASLGLYTSAGYIAHEGIKTRSRPLAGLFQGLLFLGLALMANVDFEL